MKWTRNKKRNPENWYRFFAWRPILVDYTYFNCPKGHDPMEAKKLKKKMTFKDVDLVVEVDTFVCETCGFEAGTVESAGAVQRNIVEAYRRKKGLLREGLFK